jgi:hypothetical protein
LSEVQKSASELPAAAIFRIQYAATIRFKIQERERSKNEITRYFGRHVQNQ